MEEWTMVAEEKRRGRFGAELWPNLLPCHICRSLSNGGKLDQHELAFDLFLSSTGTGGYYPRLQVSKEVAAIKLGDIQPLLIREAVQEFFIEDGFRLLDLSN